MKRAIIGVITLGLSTNQLNNTDMIHKIYYTLLCLCLLVCIGCKDNKQREFNIRMIDNDSQSDGSVQGFNDGYGGYDYKYRYDDRLKGFADASKEERAEYQEHYSRGYKKGYDIGYTQGKNNYQSEYNAELAKRQEIARQILESYNAEQVSVTTTSTPNIYPSPSVGSGSISSDEKVYGNFYNYEETDNCVEGVVVYEGDDDYFIVETRRGYTVLERRSGSLSEGHKVRGELNRTGTKYLYNRRRNSEIRVYIEDYALSDDDALEWLGEHDHLKSDNQEAYDYNNN